MKKEKLIYLLGLMVIMAAFGSIEEDEHAPLRSFFLLSDQQLTTQTWFYFLLEHLVKVMLAYLMWTEIPDFKNTFLCWFIIAIFNMNQYILKYNSVYELAGGINFSSHVITTFILAIVIFNEK